MCTSKSRHIRTRQFDYWYAREGPHLRFPIAKFGMSAEGRDPDIVIRSEADAYDILSKAANGEIDSYRSIVFDGWPSLSLYLKGEKFEQSITPTVMKGLLELQRGIYRSYSAAKSSLPGARLTEIERDELEIQVRVDGGSSSFEINFQEIAEKLVTEFSKKMSSTDVLIAVLTIAVLYCGRSAYKSYLQSRKEIRLKEVTDQTQRETLATLRFISEQETKRTEILGRLAKGDPRIANIERIANETHTEVVKSLGAGTQAKIDDISLSTDVAEMLTQNARRKADDIRLDGLYRLLKLDWSNAMHVKVRAVSIDTGLQIDAEVQDDSFTGKYKEALKAAEWSRKPIHLTINARRVGDSVRDAIIISAEMPTSDVAH
jgi:hypothetical protein